MKKAIFYTLAATFLFFSCKKDHAKRPGGTNLPEKTYKVNFNLTGFAQTINNSAPKKVQSTDLKTNAVTGAAGYLDQLYYYVFNSGWSGGPIHTLVQDSTASNFGNISDSLSAGNYTIVIAAGKPGLLSSIKGPDNLLQQVLYYKGNQFAPWNNKDTFYGAMDITVAGDITQDISLNRIVGQLQIDITDAIPATASSIAVTVDQDNLSFIMYSQTPNRPAKAIYNNVIPASAKGKTNYIINNLILNTTTPFNVTIVCYDAANTVLGTVLVPNVTCEKNKRTILTGNLFGSHNNFTVSLNDTWNATPINIPY